jgi:hypothetical protein
MIVAGATLVAVDEVIASSVDVVVYILTVYEVTPDFGVTPIAVI